MYFLTQYLAYPIEEKVREEYKADENRKHDQKINRTNSIAMTKDILIEIFGRKDYNAAIQAFDDVSRKPKRLLEQGGR